MIKIHPPEYFKTLPSASFTIIDSLDLQKLIPNPDLIYFDLNDLFDIKIKPNEDIVYFNNRPCCQILISVLVGLMKKNNCLLTVYTNQPQFWSCIFKDRSFNRSLLE